MKAYFFLRENGRAPVEEYIDTIRDRQQIAAIHAAIERLITSGGRLPRPYTAHIEGKVWELRTRLGNRVFYFIHTGADIILLDGYTKKRDRIEWHVLTRVQGLYAEYLLTKRQKPYAS